MSAAHASTPADLVLAAYSTGDADARGLITVESCIEVGVATSDIAIAKAAFHLARNAILNDDDDDCKLALSIQKASSQTLRQFQDTLLTHVLRTDVPLPFRLEAVACVTAVAAHTATNGWPKLWLNASTVLNDPNSDPSQCHVFGVFVRQAAPFLAGGPLRANLGTLMSGFEVAIMRSEHEEMVVACIAGLAHLMMSAFQDMALLHQSTAVATMLSAVEHSSSSLVAIEVMASLRSFKNQLSPLIPPHLDAFNRAVLHVMRGDGYTSAAIGNTAVAVEDMIDLNKAFKKHANFTTQYVQALFDRISAASVEVNDAWMNSCDQNDDGDAGSRCAFQLEALNVKLQGAVIGPLLLAFVDKNAHSPQWQQRAAALTVLMAAFEGHRKECLKRADSFVSDLIAPRLADEHPVVRCKAIRCFARLLTDLVKTPDGKLHFAYLIPTINSIATSDSIGRLRALAVLTLNNFFDEVSDNDHDDDDDDDTIGPFDELAFECTKAVAVCAHNANVNCVRECCLATLATLPRIAKSHLHELQALLCPIYNTYFEQWDTLSRTAQCRTLECASLLASAIGQEMFAPENVSRICETLLKIGVESLPASDELLPYVMRAWRNMAAVTEGTDGATAIYDRVVPFIAKIAATPCPVIHERVLPGDDVFSPRTDGLTVLRNESSPTLRGVMDLRVKQAKEVAISVLLHFVTECGDWLSHHFEVISAVAVEVLSFLYSESASPTAAEVLYHVGTYYMENDVITEEARENFIALVRDPILYRCFAEAQLETIAVLMLIARMAKPDQITELMIRAVASLLENDRIWGHHGEDEDEDEDDDSDCEEEDENESYQLFHNVMMLCGPLLAKMPSFSQSVFEPSVMTRIGSLVDVSQSPSPFDHRRALRALETYVDAVPAQASAHISSIAETAAYFAREASDLVVLEAAFRLSGKIAPLIVTAAGSETAKAAVMYGASILGAVTAFWDREEPSHPVAMVSVCCAVRVIDALPTSATGMSLDKLALFFVENADESVLTTVVVDLLRRWLSCPPNQSGLQYMSKAARAQLSSSIASMNDE